MIKPVLKTLSLSFLALSAVAASATEQSAVRHRAAMPVPARADCLSQSEIDRGWEMLQELVAERACDRNGGLVDGTQAPNRFLVDHQLILGHRVAVVDLPKRGLRFA